jgi:hypothetical protein
VKKWGRLFLGISLLGLVCLSGCDQKLRPVKEITILMPCGGVDPDPPDPPNEVGPIASTEKSEETSTTKPGGIGTPRPDPPGT